MSKAVKTLKQAVIDEITQGFVANECEFSAHDVTVVIRKKVNDGLLEIEGVPFQALGGVNSQLIEHADVRFLVHEHCGDVLCNIPGYERKWNAFTDGRAGGYWTWAKVGTHVDDDDDDGISQPGPAVGQSIPASSIVAGMGTGTVTAVYPPADPSDPVIVGMVTSYFEKKAGRGTPATLRDAQKRMKRNRLTVGQIKRIAIDHGLHVETPAGSAECHSLVTL